MANEVKQLTPEERAQAFAKFTRQYIQQLPAKNTTEGNTISFDAPKARLINKIRLLVEDTINVTHASDTSFTPATFAPFNFIKSIKVSANNGFSPFNVSGEGVYLYNLLHNHAEMIEPLVDTATNVAASRRRSKMGTTASSTGADNTLQTVIDLPLTLNDKNPVGLWLAQTDDTVITTTVEFDDADKLLASTTGFTTTSAGIKVTPVIETFSIPKLKEAFPDISMLKLVQEQSESFAGAGEVNVKLPVGLTYRKIIFLLRKADGTAFSDAEMAGKFELVFNQADIPYSFSPKVLAAINQEHYGMPLPKGVYVFDFASFQGLANYAGSRDLIDTEQITEFWLRFTAPAAGSIKVISESLSKLRRG